MVKEIPFTEVNPVSKKIKLQIKKDIDKIIKKKNFILGNEIKLFENNFSKISKNKYAVGCGSGTDALVLALMSLDLKKNDEVIVPGLTYISTGLSVILCGCKLILSDIDNQTGLISLDKIKEKISVNTKAVIPVNLYGQKVDLKALKKTIGNKIHIIEDSAQSHFALNSITNKINSSKVSIAECYSFYPAKNLGAYGDGGIVTTNNKNIYNKLIALRNLGSIKKNKHLLVGLNSRLDTLQAVVLNNKLKSILQLNNKRRFIGELYDNELKNVKGIKLTKTNKGSTRHLYVIRTKNRDKLKKYLLSKKISCQMHYPYSLNNLIAFKKKIRKVKLKNSEIWAKECLSLPMHPNLSKKDANRVVVEIKKYFKAL